MYLRCELMLIYNTSFMHNVRDDLLHVFINLIGFTVENIMNFIILWHCVGVRFWSKFWYEWDAKVSTFYCSVPFEPHRGSVVTLFGVLIFTHINRKKLSVCYLVNYTTWSTFNSVGTCTFYLGLGFTISFII